MALQDEFEFGRETWVSPAVEFAGRIVTVKAGGIALDDGSPAYREVVEHPGGVCVLPFDGRCVTLVRQFRIAVGEWVLEAPAGKLEPGDDIAQRARIELAEETGLHSKNLQYCGEIFGSVGFCSERIHLFLATELVSSPPKPEAEERISCEKYELAHVKALLFAHEIKDAKTIVLLHALFAQLSAAGEN